VSLALKDKKRTIGFSFAFKGILSVAKSEWNFRVHLIFMVLAVFAGMYFKLSVMEWAIIIIVIALVLITEMINTVIENIIDYLKPDIHPAAAYIKDAAAGAVLISAITAVITGILIFLPIPLELL